MSPSAGAVCEAAAEGLRLSGVDGQGHLWHSPTQTWRLLRLSGDPRSAPRHASLALYEPSTI